MTDVEASRGTIWKQIKSIAFGADSENPDKEAPNKSIDKPVDKSTDKT